MRSALSAGATGLVIGRHRSASFTPAALKAAAGAAEYLPVAVVAGVPAALATLTGSRRLDRRRRRRGRHAVVGPGHRLRAARPGARS